MSIKPIEPEYDDPYGGDDLFASDDEVDELADPFEILAQREERAGLPLIFLTIEHHD